MGIKGLTEKEKNKKEKTRKKGEHKKTPSFLPEPEDDEEEETGFCCSNPAHHKR